MSGAGCARYNMTVEAGKTYRLRVINTGSLVYQVRCMPCMARALGCELVMGFAFALWFS